LWVQLVVLGRHRGPAPVDPAGELGRRRT